MLSEAFDAETLDWVSAGQGERWRQAYAAALPAGVAGLRLSGLPLRLSAALDGALRARGEALGQWLQQQAAVQGWPGLNVVCADLLLCEGEPWSLGWVEFQAFTSVAASVDWVHELALPLWPALEGLDPHGAGLAPIAWRHAFAEWVRAGGDGPVAVLEHQPWQQGTASDFVALRERFGWPVVEPGALQARQGRVCWEGEALAAVLNRVVEPSFPGAGGAAWAVLCQARDTHWHSPPWLYGAVNKRLMLDWHREAPAQGVEAAPVAHWRSLGLPAVALVAKPVLGLGGQGVMLAPTADALDALAADVSAGDWLVQRRLRPLAFWRNADGVPLQIEFRLMLDCTPGRPVCLMSRLGRVSARGQPANASGYRGVQGEGLALLLA